MDKIGAEGVRGELTESGFPEDCVDRYMDLFAVLQGSGDPLTKLKEILPEADAAPAEGLKEIRTAVEAASETDFRMLFDPTLVRGMSYYTGPIFEIELAGLGCAAGGGGRYDELVGKFTNLKIPACGLSLGFERLITILLEEGFRVPGSAGKTAFLTEKNLSAEETARVRKEAAELRKTGVSVLVTAMNKNKRFQKEQLSAEGYTEFREFYRQ